ncbi:MAG: hypothetical protein ACREQL_13550, partial [Candidatus Binatia bacterium]
MRRALVRGLVVLAGYTAALVWLTWPLGAHLTTHLPLPKFPCVLDVPYITWALAWQSHALATDPAHYVDANIYYPDRGALFYGDPGLSALPLFAPVFLATGNPTLAINVVFLGGLALSATALHLVVASWTGTPLAGVVAAATLLANPQLTWGFLPWAPSYAVLALFPVLMRMAARPRRHWRDVLVQGVLIALQALANLVYVAIAVVGPLAVLALARVARRPTRADGLRLAASIALALLLMAPVYAGFAIVLRANPGVGGQSQWASAHVEVPDALRMFAVTVGGVVRPIISVPSGLFERSFVLWVATPTIFLVLAGGALAMIARGRRGPPASAWAHGALWAVIGLVLATPVAALPGRPVVALPHYVALAWLAPTLQEAIRDPDRIALASLMGWALLAGAAFASVVSWLPARGRRMGAAVLAVVVTLALFRDYPPEAMAAYPLWVPVRGDSEVLAAVRARPGPVLD